MYGACILTKGCTPTIAFKLLRDHVYKSQIYLATVLVIQQIPTNCVQANYDKLRVLPHIIFTSRRDGLNLSGILVTLVG